MLSSRQGHAAVCRERALKAEVVYFLITSLEEEFCATADFFSERLLTPEERKPPPCAEVKNLRLSILCTAILPFTFLHTAR